MKIERPQAAVPWVPSRHRYALFRLVAFLRLVRTPSALCVGNETRVLAIDRDQSTGEAFAIGTLVWFTATAFMTQLLSSRLITPVAVFIAIPLALFTLNAAVVVIGLVITPLLHLAGLPRGPNNIGPNSAVVLIALALFASYFATSTGWVAAPAWIFLACVVVNGLAAIVLFALRDRVRAEEKRCVV